MWNCCISGAIHQGPTSQKHRAMFLMLNSGSLTFSEFEDKLWKFLRKPVGAWHHWLNFWGFINPSTFVWKNPSLTVTHWSRGMHRVRTMRAETGIMIKGTKQRTEAENPDSGDPRSRDNPGNNPEARSGHRKQAWDPKTHYDRSDGV